mmetsp:Transcript_1694/g.3771  ORF Transcript_1694/g.3771 Transcript_1694/m.3771 type:complete len:200 (+) Transcript_1694:506-1105(+)
MLHRLPRCYIVYLLRSELDRIRNIKILRKMFLFQCLAYRLRGYRSMSKDGDISQNLRRRRQVRIHFYFRHRALHSHLAHHGIVCIHLLISQTGIDNPNILLSQIVHDVLGHGRTDVTELVRARRCYRHLRRIDQRPRDRMGGRSTRDVSGIRHEYLGDGGVGACYEGEWAWEEVLGEGCECPFFYLLLLHDVIVGVVGS